MIEKKTKARRRHIDPKQLPPPAKAATRSGSNAGRGFRYQDAVFAWLAVEIWAGLRTPAIVIPEGGDDVELRGDGTTFIQVKSRREHLGDYSEGAAAPPPMAFILRRCYLIIFARVQLFDSP